MLQPLWSIAIVALVGFFVWHQRAELTQAIRELRLADWRWLGLIVISSLLMHGLITQALSSVILRIGPRIPLVPALMTHAEREMIAAVMPMGGAASYVTLVSRFGPYGVTHNNAALAVMLYSAVGHLSFIAVAIPAIVLLIVQGNATGPILLGAVAFLLIAAAIGVLVASLLRGKRFPETIERRLPGFVHEFQETAATTQIPARSLLVPLAFSLGADLMGVVSMWAALHAVRADAALVTALAAYTVGTMLQLVAPVFQGLGVVEVSVIYVLQRLGVPLPQAIGATILYRFVDVWLPVVLGVGVHAQYQRALRGFPAYLPAIWTALSGILALVSVLPLRVHIPHVDFERAQGFGILHEYHAGRTFTLVAGFLLLLLSIRLMRRQHAAWIIALVISSLLTVFYVLRDIDDVGAIISGTNVAILLIYRSRFRVRSDIPTLRRGVYVLLASFGVTFFYAAFSLWIADRRHFGREFSFVSSLRAARDIFFGFGDGGLTAHTARGEWIIDSIHVLAVLSILVSAFAILQPIIWRHRVQHGETERAQQLVERFGDSGLDRFKYWPDKHQFFARDGLGVVSFGLSNRVALVLGDPTAKDERSFGEVLDEFLEVCEVNGWEPAFHQVPPVHLDAYRERGFTTMMIGRDAIVPVETFSLSGKSMGGLRSTRNRAAREGVQVEHVEPPLSDELIRELKDVSDEWLTLEGRRERTFTLGQFETDYIRESPVLVMRSAGGRVEAFINLIPDGAPGEMTFDLMRHRVDAPNGAMDLLMLALIDLAKAQGCTSVSLGMVPFVNPEPEEAVGRTDRAIGQLARPMSRFFASESLFAYKNKFRPIWEPRYLVVRSVTHLPRVALALTRLSELHEHGSTQQLITRELRRNGDRRHEPRAATDRA